MRVVLLLTSWGLNEPLALQWVMIGRWKKWKSLYSKKKKKKRVLKFLKCFKTDFNKLKFKCSWLPFVLEFLEISENILCYCYPRCFSSAGFFSEGIAVNPVAPSHPAPTNTEKYSENWWEEEEERISLTNGLSWRCEDGGPCRLQIVVRSHEAVFWSQTNHGLGQVMWHARFSSLKNREGVWDGWHLRLPVEIFWEMIRLKSKSH